MSDVFRSLYEIIRIDADPPIVRVARRAGGPPWVAVQGEHVRLFAEPPPDDPGFALPSAGYLGAILASPEFGRFVKRKAVGAALRGAELLGVQSTFQVPDRYAKACELLQEIEGEIVRAIRREQAAAPKEDADAVLNLRGIDAASYEQYQRFRVLVADDPGAQRLLEIADAEPPDPATAWRNVTRDIQEWRRRGVLETIAPGDALAGAFGSVVLRGIAARPVVFGVEVDPITEDQYYVILELVRAGAAGISKADLEAGGNVSDPVNVLRRMRNQNPATWGRAIVFPGGKGRGGYRIAPA